MMLSNSRTTYVIGPLVVAFVLIYLLIVHFHPGFNTLFPEAHRKSVNPDGALDRSFPDTISHSLSVNITVRQSHSDRFPRRCAPFPLKFHVDESLFDCNWYSSIPPNCTHRLRANLMCRPSSAVIEYEWVSVDTPPSVYDFNDDCLARVVKAKCFLDGKDLVPNLSHYVIFGGHMLTNYTFLSLISSVRFLQPCLVMAHSDILPIGRYWDTVVRLVPQLIHVKRLPPKSIFGHRVNVIEHSSDIARLEAVKKFGGVYQDTDYIMVNPFDDLRGYSVVMGKTIPNTNYANGIFMGKPEAQFLNVWYNSYRTFNDKQWGYHSTIMPYKIHHERPELPFHEVNTFVTPYFANIEKLFYNQFLNWRRLHGIHLYVRYHRKRFAVRYDQQNSSLGQVTRRVLFGDSEACFGGLREVYALRMNITDLTP